jgi:hypothetical protein
MGFPRGYTAVEGLTDAARHQLVGNSFSVPVVAQLLAPLRELAEARDDASAAVAVARLQLREAETPAARRWCSLCESAACCFVH